MNTEHRYILEKNSKKYECPSCGKKTFTRVVDTEIGELISDEFGRCDRESNCGYENLVTKEVFLELVKAEKYNTEYPTKKNIQKAKLKPKKNTISTSIPEDILYSTMKDYDRNIFLQNLAYNIAYPLPECDIEKVVSMYYLGTVSKGYRRGAITFPFIDENKKVRAIQVKQFDQKNHTTGTDFLPSIIEKHYTRNKKPLPKWLESYNKNETKVSCLFGEHLLNKYSSNPIALVEAPKTAVYGTLYFGFPDDPKNFLWLGVYNLSSLKIERCKVLKGRDVYLFPDLSKTGHAYELWETRAREFEKKLPGTRFTISDFLEKNASQEQKNEGCDLADFLIETDWREYRELDNEPEKLGLLTESDFELIEEKKQYNFNTTEAYSCFHLLDDTKEELYDTTELEEFFRSAEFPSTPVELNSWTTITDIPKFLERHLSYAKANSSKRGFEVYYDRLCELKDYINFLDHR
ncbi:MAG: DUF6371 domain-containing protein [Bacteroidota bacterium]